MLTDGITECENSAGQEFGLAPVKAAVLETDPIGEVVRQVQQFCDGRELQDDCTMMIMDRLHG